MPPGRGGPFGRDDSQKVRFRKNSNRKLWKWMFSYLKEHKKQFGLYLVLLFVLTTIGAFLPIFNQRIIDEGILGPENPAEAWEKTGILMIQYAILLFVTYIGTGLIDYKMGKMGTTIVANIREDVFKNVQNMSMDYFHKNKTGDIISIATNDVDQLNMIFSGQLAMMIATLFRAILIIFLMFFLNWRLALISLCMFPIMLFLSGILKNKVQKAFMETRKKISSLTQVTEQNISGIKVIQGFGKQKESEEKFQKANWINRQTFMKARKIMAFLIPLLLMVANIFILVLLGLGTLSIKGEIGIFGDTITIGKLSAFSSYLTQLIFPLLMITMFMQMAESALAASDRIYETLNKENSLLDPEKGHPIKNIEGKVSFHDVTFKYSDREIKKEKDYELYDKKEGKAQVKSILKKIPPHVRIKTSDSLKEFKKQYPNQYEEFLTLDPRIKMLMLKISMEEKQEIIGYFQQLDKEHKKNFLQRLPKLIKQIILQKENKQIKQRTVEERLKMLDKMRNFFNTPESFLLVAEELHSRINKNGKINIHDQQFESLETKGKQKPISPKEGELIENEKKLIREKLGTENGFQNIMIQLKRMNRNELLNILGNPHVPQEIFEQFPQDVKNAIHLDQKRMGHKAGPVIKDVSFRIQPGKTAAFVGETGAGKSTIIKLIARFYDVEDGKGKVCIDDIKIKNFKKDDLRKLIGMVPQDNFTFSGTILENLYYGLPEEIPRELNDKVLEISKYLGLHDFIKNKAGKYNMELKEMGKNISVGQRQLICLARVLMTDPKILILDEATSAIDPHTEKIIQDAIDKVRKDRTTIIIAHRLSTIRDADIIFVMDDGKIIEKGSHGELMEMGGTYASLVNIQGTTAS